jgi:type II secretory pathway pseudopilin PulG
MHGLIGGGVWAERTLRVAANAVVVLIGLMGLMKLLDLPAFGAAVRHWRIIPRDIRPGVVVIVPILETALLVWLLLNLRRAYLLLSTLSLLIIFSGLYVVQWYLYDNTPCGCFGALARRFAEIETAQFALTRNVVMACVLALELWGMRRRRTVQKSRVAGTLNAREVLMEGGDTGRAFTTVEILVVVAVLGVLMALTMPMLARVRNGARASVTVANLRSHSAVLLSYTIDYKDLFPALTNPRASYSVIRCESASVAVRAAYFDQFNLWNVGLADQYYDGSFRTKAFHSGWDSIAVSPRAGLHLACSFSADPSYYDADTRTAPPAQLRPIKATEVLFASKKSLMTAYTPWVHFQRVFGGMVDGQASEFRNEQLVGDLRSGDGAYAAFGFHWPAYTPMTHTYRGVRGRDIR